jgi:hypothetical protein
LEQAFAARRVTLDPLGIPELAGCRTVIYTPSMTTTPKRLSNELHQLRWSLHYIVEDALHAEEDDADLAPFDDRWTELVIVDEADRLKIPTLDKPLPERRSRPLRSATKPDRRC